jgi:hypothetical protein
VINLIAKTLVILWFGLTVIYSITKIGKPAEPMTPGEVALGALWNGALIALVVMCWETE